VRDLLFIDDLVRAFRLAALNIETTAGQVYNIGGGPANSVSIWQELRPRLEEYVGKPLDITLDEWRPGDQPVYISDTRKAARDFGWRPQVEVEVGLRRLWDWAVHLTESRATTIRNPRRTPIALPIAKKTGIAFAGPSA
jgi:CDP-paratose 2-epimerase